jgi:hypothetical protein
MKCLRLHDVKKVESGKSAVIRTTDTLAAKLVKKGKAEYVPKSVWKEAGRP